MFGVSDGINCSYSVYSNSFPFIVLSTVYSLPKFAFAKASARGSSNNTPAELNGSGLWNINLLVEESGIIFFLENTILLSSFTVSVAPQEKASFVLSGRQGIGVHSGPS